MMDEKFLDSAAHYALQNSERYSRPSTAHNPQQHLQGVALLALVVELREWRKLQQNVIGPTVTNVGVGGGLSLRETSGVEL